MVEFPVLVSSSRLRVVVLMNARIQLCVVACALACTFAGCGGAKVVQQDPNALPSVSCKVQLNGKDIQGAIVELAGTGAPDRKIKAVYDPESELYTFITIEGKEKRGGVAAGEYTVSVKPGQTTKAKIPAKYADAAKSGLRIEVKPGINKLPPIELAS